MRRRCLCTRLHSVANFCNKKLRVEFYSTISRHAKTDESIVLVIWLNERVLGSERMLKRLRLRLKGNTVGIRSSTRYCVVIVRRNSHCGDMPLSKDEAQRSKVKSQRSKVKRRRSKVKGQKSKDEGQRSKVKRRRSKDEGQRSKVKGRKSKVKRRRSKVKGRRSKVKGRKTKRGL